MARVGVSVRLDAIVWIKERTMWSLITSGEDSVSEPAGSMKVRVLVKDVRRCRLARHAPCEPRERALFMAQVRGWVTGDKGKASSWQTKDPRQVDERGGGEGEGCGEREGCRIVLCPEMQKGGQQ